MLEEFIDRLDSFFKSRGLVFSYKELYAGFAACISKHAFLKYLAVQRDQDPLFLRLMGTFRVDVVQPINCGKFLDLGMFFRHPLFYDVFVGSGSVGKFPSVKSRKRASTASIVEHLRLKNYGLSDYGTEVIQIVCTILANKNEIFNATRPILGLGSSHGIYSPSGVVGLLKCLRSGGELILVQPGLIHSQAKYIYQVKYEQNISTKHFPRK